MSKKVLFLDEDTGICRNYAELLKDHSFELVSVDSYDQMERAIDEDGCEAMVFGAPDNEAKWKLCKELMAQRPHFPVLFILINDCYREAEIVFNSFHRIVRPLTQKSFFMSELSNLIEVGSLVSGRAKPSGGSGASDGGLARDEGVLDTLDISKVTSALTEKLAIKTNSDQVIWIIEEEWEKLQSEPGSYELHNGVNVNGAVNSFPEQPQEKVVNKLRELFAKTTQETNRKGDAQQFKLVGSAESAVQIPVVYDETKTGRFVLVSCDKEGADSAGKSIEEYSEATELLKDYERHLMFCVQHLKARHLSFKDDLTDLYNQRYLPTVLQNEIDRSKREDAKFSVLFMDVDYFKIVNDTRGHLVGSKLLKHMGQLIKDNTRATDYGFRYGGDEFVVVLSGAATAEATVVAERIRQLIENTQFQVENVELNLTVSIGLATFPDHAQSSEQLIKMADQAMYYGKHKSRNIVYIAS